MASLIATRMEANELLRKHGLAARGWTFEYDNARRRGGQCRYRDKTITMSKYLVPMWTEAQVTETLIHEVAHALVGAGHGHGAVWARKMRELGKAPERCHSNATVEPPLHAICPTHGVIAKRHRRLSGAICRTCAQSVTWVDTRLALV